MEPLFIRLIVEETQFLEDIRNLDAIYHHKLY